MTFVEVLNTSILNSLKEFDEHVAVYSIYNNVAKMQAFVAIHRMRPGSPSFGATRIFPYTSKTDALKDVLRLSRLMSYKAALAGFPCGGAKAVIIEPSQKITTKQRREILGAYAEGLATLAEKFITGTDVGISQEDLFFMKQTAPNLTGFSGEATDLTAYGVLCAIKAAAEFIYGTHDISAKSFAIQGLGKVGTCLLSLVYRDDIRVFVSDVNESRVREITRQFPGVVVVSPSDIHKQQVDIFCPCAMSGVLNEKTVPELNCQIIGGGANNQLINDEIGGSLFDREILYIPDYVANSGGLIAVYDEYSNGSFVHDRAVKKVESIGNITKKLILESRKEKKPMNLIANRAAELLFT